MTRTFGKVDDRTSVQVSQGGTGANLFLKLEANDNKVRLFGDTYRTWIHWFTTSDGQRRKANCAGDNCPLCRAASKPEEEAKPRFYNCCINRADGTVKILDMGSQIFKGVQALDADENWGSLEEYDINIKKGPKGSSPLYQVTPLPKKDLSKTDLALIEASKSVINLEKLVAPSTVEFINKLIKGEIGKSADNEDAPKKAAKKVPKANSETDEQIDSFFNV